MLLKGTTQSDLAVKLTRECSGDGQLVSGWNCWPTIIEVVASECCECTANGQLH